MGLKCGIVGLPNVGKSTLFNAITNTAQAQANNYPFCTIEPNIGRIAVPDDRLFALAKIANSQEVIPNFIEIMDIAGLVKGASKGEGLGNQFLGNIRSVNAIIHVVRCFEDDNIIHVENNVNPLQDIEVIETELMLADLQSLQKKGLEIEKRVRAKDKEALMESEVISAITAKLNSGQSIHETVQNFSQDQLAAFKQLQLLTAKPVLYVANVSENDIRNGNKMVEDVKKHALSRNCNICIICAKTECDLVGFDVAEKEAYLKEIGETKTGLDKIAQQCYALLNLITFFTIGPKEAHAWSVKKGALAPEAAGEIHTDFTKGFIRAETISCKDYIRLSGEQGAKAAGCMRLEGKEYQVQDGDIFHFRFNV